jgi:hypothetical protein
LARDDLKQMGSHAETWLTDNLRPLPFQLKNNCN